MAGCVGVLGVACCCNGRKGCCLTNNRTLLLGPSETVEVMDFDVGGGACFLESNLRRGAGAGGAAAATGGVIYALGE